MKRLPNQCVQPTAGCAFSFPFEPVAGGGSRFRSAPVKRLSNNAGRAAAALVAALVLIPTGLYLRFPPGPRPLCHRGIDSAFQQWMLATGQTNAYPNAEGNGPASLAMVQPYFGERIQQYAYIPGLREDDPEDLV